jgi:hypothetical protein
VGGLTPAEDRPSPDAAARGATIAGKRLSNERRPAGETVPTGRQRPGEAVRGSYSSRGLIAWNVGLSKTLLRQAPLSWSLALPTE